jgi:hypothetical protein
MGSVSMVIVVGVVGIDGHRGVPLDLEMFSPGPSVYQLTRFVHVYFEIYGQ